MVHSAVETMGPVIEASHHELTITLPPEPIHLEADPIRLAQVLANLLNNSAKYTEKGGRISLEAERDNDHVVIHVRDNGIGIPEEMLPHIFDLFTQGDHSIHRSQGGLGVGLTLVQRLVEMHGGTIHAHSNGPGQGSEFVVRLPMAAEQEAIQVDGSKQSTGPSASAVSPRRILVVDDNRDAAESLAVLLRMMGHDVRIAHDGMTALGMAADHPAHLAFLDIGMPGMDGYELAKKLRQLPGLDNMFLVALTGLGQADDRRRTEAAGFDLHLVKPIEPDALPTVLTRVGQTAQK